MVFIEFEFVVAAVVLEFASVCALLRGGDFIVMGTRLAGEFNFCIGLGGPINVVVAVVVLLVLVVVVTPNGLL